MGRIKRTVLPLVIGSATFLHLSQYGCATSPAAHAMRRDAPVVKTFKKGTYARCNDGSQYIEMVERAHLSFSPSRFFLPKSDWRVSGERVIDNDGDGIVDEIVYHPVMRKSFSCGCEGTALKMSYTFERGEEVRLVRVFDYDTERQRFLRADRLLRAIERR